MKSTGLEWMDDGIRQAVEAAMGDQAKALDKCYEDMHRGRQIMLDAVAAQLEKMRSVEPLPFYAEVAVEHGFGTPAEAVGKVGVVVGRTKLTSERWIYDVHFGDLGTSYVLLQAALTPTGKVLAWCDLYDGKTVQVGVDEAGEGHLL